ncbi:MAG: hypothetical protein R3326_08465 [Gemmatimonadota bacterium]|nr:hypothetical protein [Gemmatimonadota bacterium]
MKLAFVKFVMIVALGTTISAWGGSTLAAFETTSEKPARVEVEILETAGLCQEEGTRVSL